jgi:hypothetical protein
VSLSIRKPDEEALHSAATEMFNAEHRLPNERLLRRTSPLHVGYLGKDPTFAQGPVLYVTHEAIRWSGEATPPGCGLLNLSSLDPGVW